jgi:protein TonB
MRLAALMTTALMPVLAFAQSTATSPRPDYRRSNPRLWITTADYPARAKAEKRWGTSHLNLTIDETGKPSGCSVAETSGHADLDEQACALLMSRALFHPAADQSGQSVEATLPQKVTWWLPKISKPTATPVLP